MAFTTLNSFNRVFSTVGGRDFLTRATKYPLMLTLDQGFKGTDESKVGTNFVAEDLILKPTILNVSIDSLNL